ncbi:MAG: (2Fe-2S)-binding protein [Pseudomonadota bacterium]
MYVCLCNGVTEKHIYAAVENGARSVSDLKAALKVTSICGKCASCAKEHLKSCELDACPKALLKKTMNA